MARKFSTTGIVSPVKARLRADSFTHINSAQDEISKAALLALIPSYTTNDVIVIWGAVVSGTIVAPGPCAVTAGQVYYNGRFYDVDAATGITLAGAQIPVWNIVESLQGGQSVFTDGNNYDFQVIEKFALQAGLSGSGLKNNADVKRLKKTKRVSTGFWDMTAAPFIDVAHGLSATEFLTAVVSGVSIRRDDFGEVYSLGTTYSTTTNGVGRLSSTLIRLVRETGGVFDGVNFNDATIIRGYIDITYGDI